MKTINSLATSTQNTASVVSATATSDIIACLLTKHKQQVEVWIQEKIPTLGNATILRDACEYALLNGGKRIRPAIVSMVAEGLGFLADVSQAALAIEFFHTASLVADDLPCMDDDDERRQKPSLHKVYGDAMALLVSYALIAAGYECIAKNAEQLRASNLLHSSQNDRICTLALENATYNTGLNGATGGQFLDVFPPNLSLEALREIIHKKTVSLFEISFVFGWLFGGGNFDQLPLVKKAASHYGMAFQIADDLDDVEQDIASGKKVNLAIVAGKPAAQQMFHEEIEGYLSTLKELDIATNALQSIVPSV